MEDCRIKYIRSLNNVVKDLDNKMDDEDRSNINRCIGYLFQEIYKEGSMTRELAKYLDLEILLSEGE